MNGIGARIRDARMAQEKSLNEVASRAKISAATLSRIETEKQGVGISLFLLLAKILKVHPNELIGEPESGDRSDPIVHKLAAMGTGERTQVWQELSTLRRDSRTRRSREASAAAVGAQIEELLAQIDYLRQEIDAMRVKVATRQKARR